MAQGSIRIRCKVCRKEGVKDGFMASDPRACKHKERVFQALFPREGGGQIPKTVPTFKLAQDWLHEIASQVNKGIYKDITPATVKEMADKYLASVRINCRPASYTNLVWGIEKHILPYIGNKAASSVTHTMISDIMAKIENMSYSLRAKVRTDLKAIFEFAETAGALKENPTRKIKVIKRSSKDKRLVILTNRQIKLLVEAPKDPMVKLYYKMAIYTGMRPNELGAIKISDINLDRKQVKVQRSIYWYKTLKERAGHPEPYIFQHTKTDAGARTLPLTPELVKEIQIHLIEARENKHGLLFARPDGDPVKHQVDIVERHFNKDIKSLNESAEIPKVEFPVIDFYNLRHTYCSILAEMNVPIKKMQEYMGHADFDTTMNIYAKVRPDESDDFGTKLEAFVGGNNLVTK